MNHDRIHAAIPLAAALAVALFTSGCSLQRMAVNRIGDSLAAGGGSFASDDDPELVREATPFSLKLIESLLEQVPRHRGLLLAASRGFTQYAYGFLQQEADYREETDYAASRALRERARKLYLRAHGYGMRGLALDHRDFAAAFGRDPEAALATLKRKDLDLLYWTGISWMAAISLAKDDPEQVAQIPQAEAMLRRAFALDENYGEGALHQFYITYGARPEEMGGSPAEAREHFQRAVELTGGQSAGPYVALAESVALPEQNRPEFEELLHQALAIDVDRKPEYRLMNLLMQERARWLLAQADLLFVP